MVTFIFGAGASIPFFDKKLSTVKLTEQLQHSETWRNILQKFKENWLESKPFPDIDVKEVLSLICDVRHINSDATFEDIIEIVDKVALYKSTKSDNVKENLFCTTLSIIAPDSFLDKSDTDSWWKYVPFLCREIIATYILQLEEEYKDYDLYKDLVRKQKNLFEDYAYKDQTSIVSLNYDETVIESALQAGYDACQQYNNRREIVKIDAKSILNKKKLVYFPHGHIRLTFNIEKDAVEYHSSSKYADEARWEDLKCAEELPAGCFSEKDFQKFRNFIITGKSKDDILNNAPFSFYYQRFAIDCKDSNVIVIIGYSFGDEHINRFLGHFLQLSKENILIVIDKRKEINIEKENKLPENALSTIKKIRELTDNNVNIRVDSNGTKKLHEDFHDEERINDVGYGRLFSQVYYYRNGYEKFLNEYQDVFKYINTEKK